MPYHLPLRIAALVFLPAWSMAFMASGGAAADEYDQPPIEYRHREPANSITELQTLLDRGETKLAYDNQFGYLPALLKALDVSPESQMLVFSKTSLQLRRISPKTPRAIYFNDDVYIGYCQSGEVIEITVADPQLGAVFYTVEQQASDNPRFQRNVDNCLICHSSSRTENVPGHLVRSIFVDESGQPIFSAGSHSVDHTTPLDKRWGGWYVTGKHGSQTHLGNLTVPKNVAPHSIENVGGQNVVELKDRFDAGQYLTPHSDIVALMVLEHQTLVHNRLTKANFATRQALDYEATLNRALGEPADNRLESTTRRIQRAGDDLIDALLFVDEVKLTAPISGTSKFAEAFTRPAVRDSRQRSLRDLDLHDRMFKYPCSYLIYSKAFDELPHEVRDYVLRELWQILSGGNTSEKFAHLSSEDRQAIREIIRETKPNLPDVWKAEK